MNIFILVLFLNHLFDEDKLSKLAEFMEKIIFSKERNIENNIITLKTVNDYYNSNPVSHSKNKYTEMYVFYAKINNKTAYIKIGFKQIGADADFVYYELKNI